MKPNERMKEIEECFTAFEEPMLMHAEEDLKWLLARVKQLEKAIESACYRHHIECDKKCISLCPVRIGKEVLSTGPKPE
jgi:hypothetical protein